MRQSLVGLLIGLFVHSVASAGTGFAISDTQVTEGDSGTNHLSFTISLDTCPTGCSVMATALTLTGNGAIEGEDYMKSVTNLGFPSSPGPQNQTFQVPVIGESLVELNETLTVLLTDPVGAPIDDAVATGTIINNDSATLQISDAQRTEGLTLFLTLQLSNPVDHFVSVIIAASDGTATLADDDYTFTSHVIDVPANSTQSSRPGAGTVGDPKVEMDETLLFTYSDFNSGFRDVTLLNTESTGTILNDDSGRLSITDLSLLEGNSGATQFNFSVILDREVDTGVEVDFETQDGTATTADNDYEFTVGTLMFQGLLNEDELVSVTVNGDLDQEPDEEFVVRLSGIDADGRDIQFEDHLGTGTILNDDAGQIFSDGFESGDTLAWTSTVP